MYMESTTFFLLAADAILIMHVLFVAFVVIGLVLILFGKCRRWSWVQNPRFRLLHLLAIAVVVVQSWFNIICPLTEFEMVLRSQGGDTAYKGSFIAYWLETILYFQAPTWVFTVSYTVFGAVVVVSWFWVKPRPFTKPSQN